MADAGEELARTGAGADSDSEPDFDEPGLTPFERVVRMDAFKRALDEDEQHDRYAEVAAGLDAIADQMKLWVKNTATEHDPTKETQTFVITVFPQTPIKDIRATIFRTLGLQAKPKRFEGAEEKGDEDGSESEKEVDSDAEELDAATTKKLSKLKLIYRGLVLEDGKVFDDYEWKKEKWKWSKPYAGVVWISPFHPEPRFRSIRRPLMP